MAETPVSTAPTPIGEQATLETLRIVFDAAPFGIAISGQDSRLRLVNQRLADILGYSRDELVGLGWRELTHPDDAAIGDELTEQLDCGDEAPAAVHMRYVHKSGREVWTSLTARAVIDSTSGERVTLALIQDTSSQRRSEELTRALSEQTSRLAAIIQKTPLAVILTNEEGEITYLNRAALDMLSIPQAIGALGQSIGLIDMGEGGPAAAMVETVKRDGRWSGERLFHTVSGAEMLPVHVTAFRLDAQQSGVGSLAFVAQDIRERKAIEIALREREDQLRRLARRLIRAQEQERSRIARDLHDDVTQRLAMIAVEIGFLQSDPESDQDLLSEKLGTIRNQVIELTDSVRDLSHQYHPSALSHSNLHAALESLCYEFENQHGIRARFRGRADTVKVARSIATAIYRIVQEALRNVARHSGAQGVVLTVECDDNELRLALLDDGKGFDRTEITKRRGLGLTSMEERALAIGGSIEFHSELGAGVRIELTAPVAEGCDEDAEDGIG